MARLIQGLTCGQSVGASFGSTQMASAKRGGGEGDVTVICDKQIDETARVIAPMSQLSVRAAPLLLAPNDRAEQVQALQLPIGVTRLRRLGLRRKPGRRRACLRRSTFALECSADAIPANHLAHETNPVGGWGLRR